MIAEFIKPHDPRWMSILADTRHDFYHLPEYIEFAAEHEDGVPCAFYAEDGDVRFLAPLLKRNIPDELKISDRWYDVASPYGYPAPIMTSTDNTDSIAGFLEAFRRCCNEQCIVSAFFRLHPLLPLPLYRLAAAGTLIHHGQTVFIDLSSSIEDLQRHIRRNHRRDIKRLAEDGFDVVNDDWSFFDAFIEMYKETMERNSAQDFYLFSKSYFYKLREVLGDRIHFQVVLTPDGEPAAGILCIVEDGIVQDHLGASSDKYSHYAPTKLGLDYRIRWAQRAGYSVIHMGGGIGGTSDSLFNFKAGFSNTYADFYTYRIVLDQSKYDKLLRLYSELNGIEFDQGNYFPGYRAPLSSKKIEMKAEKRCS